MGTARLAETTHQDRVGGLEEDDLRRNHTGNGFQDLGELFELGAFTHIQDERGAADFARLHSQVSKLWDELDWKIVDAVVAEVFKGLEH